MELFATTRKTLEEDGWLPGSFDVNEDHSEAEKIKASAVHFIEGVLDFNPDATEQIDLRDKHLASVEHLGGKARNASLKLIGQIRNHFPVIEKQLEERSWLSSNVNAIGELSRKLDPYLNHLREDRPARFLERLPFFPSAARGFFLRFDSERTQTVELGVSLEKIADVLEKDIELFKDQIRSLSELSHTIGKNVYLGRLIRKGLQKTLEKDLMAEDPRREFIENEQIPRLKNRLSNLRLQLDLNRAFLTSLTVILINTEILFKALSATGKNLVSAFNLGAVMADERISLKIQPIDSPEDSDVPRTVESLSASFKRISESASAVRAFMKASLEAFRESSGGLDRLQQEVEDAFQAARMVDLSRTARDGDRL